MKIREYVKEIKIRGVYIIITGIITMLWTYRNAWEIMEIWAGPLQEAIRPPKVLSSYPPIEKKGAEEQDKNLALVSKGCLTEEGPPEALSKYLLRDQVLRKEIHTDLPSDLVECLDNQVTSYNKECTHSWGHVNVKAISAKATYFESESEYEYEYESEDVSEDGYVSQAQALEELLYKYKEQGLESDALSFPQKKGLNKDLDGGFHLILTEITEAFIAATELAISITIYMLIPIILYQIWLFVKPGLYEYEKKELKRQYKIYCVLSLINVIITYWIILPATCKFFLSFSSYQEISNMNEDVLRGSLGKDLISTYSRNPSNEEDLIDNKRKSCFSTFSFVEIKNLCRPSLEIHLEAKIKTYMSFVGRTIYWGQVICQIPTLTIMYITSGQILDKYLLRTSIKKKKERKKEAKITSTVKRSTSTSTSTSTRTTSSCYSSSRRNQVLISTSKKDLKYLSLEQFVKEKEKIKKRQKRARGLCYLVSIILSGIIAPPDIISQVIIAIPIIIIYEMTIYLVCIKSVRKYHSFCSNKEDLI